MKNMKFKTTYCANKAFVYGYYSDKEKIIYVFSKCKECAFCCNQMCSAIRNLYISPESPLRIKDILPPLTHKIKNYEDYQNLQSGKPICSAMFLEEEEKV